MEAFVGWKRHKETVMLRQTLHVKPSLVTNDRPFKETTI